MGGIIMNKYLEMWKTERLIGWMDCIFDTCFLTFIWIMGWTTFFWVYLVLFAIIPSIAKARIVLRLEKKFGFER